MSAFLPTCGLADKCKSCNATAAAAPPAPRAAGDENDAPADAEGAAPDAETEASAGDGGAAAPAADDAAAAAAAGSIPTIVKISMPGHVRNPTKRPLFATL